MPWNGSGTYTRAYASWSSDSSNNLPISATKFDLEDNDFAAGIQNCLTIDGQNKPNTTVNWAQAIALTKAADGTLFSVSRTGGSNNPGLQLQLTDATGATINLTTAQQLALATNSAIRITLSGTGNVAVNAPSAGVALSATGVSGSPIAKMVSGSGAAVSTNDFEIDRAGSTANQIAEGPNLVLNDTTNSTDTCLQMSGGQTELWQFNGSWVQQWRVTTGGIFQARDQGGTMQDLGWRGTPLNTQVSNYTLVLADRGKTINIGNGVTITIPSATFAAGDVISFMIGSGGTATLAQGSGLTLEWAGNGSTTGSRTFTGAGIAAVVFQSASVAFISGAGLS